MDEVVDALRGARHVLVYTGAGVSAESGIPTFRGGQGLWDRFRIEDLATPDAFARHPQRVWGWYAWRMGLVAAAQPNAAHQALAGMERHYPEFLLVTQNVDDLHERAGSEKMLHVHGRLMETHCTACGRVEPVSTPPAPDAIEAGELPRCACGGLLRPNVVWFGEMLEPRILETARKAAARCDLLLIIGTGGTIGGGYGLVEHASASGATLIEINPEPSILSSACYCLRTPAAEALGDIWAAVTGA